MSFQNKEKNINNDFASLILFYETGKSTVFVEKKNTKQ